MRYRMVVPVACKRAPPLARADTPFRAEKRDWLAEASRRCRAFASGRTQEIRLDRRVEWTLAPSDARS